MPGVTHVAIIPTGVAVRATTFGQCIDAVRALDVEWNAGTVSGKSSADILKEVRAAQLPLAVPKLGALSVEGDFVFHFRSGSALEPNCAVADVRDDTRDDLGRARSRRSTRSRRSPRRWGSRSGQVTVNVVQGGGSFGRKLFSDAAIEAAHASKAFGAPVKLMWHRADEPRQGRVHPMATSRIRATVLAGSVISFEQRHTSVPTDFRHGLGERLTAEVAALPTGLGNLGLLGDRLPAHPGAALQLRRHHAAAQRAQAGAGPLQHQLRAQHLLARRGTRQRAHRRPAGRSGCNRDPVAFRRAHAKSRVRQAGAGPRRRAGRVGQADAGRHRAGHRDPQGVQGRDRRSSWRSTAAPRRSTGRSATPSPGHGSRRATVVIDAGLVINPRGHRGPDAGWVHGRHGDRC